jgi:hypothetical protein
VTYMTYTKTELDGFYRRMRAPARPQPEVVDEFSPAVVHELTERATGVLVSPKRHIGSRGTATSEGLPMAPADAHTPARSVSVVCRLCHGDLDESLFCSLCGVVTLP